MIPSGGNNGWATEVISTILLYPRQGQRNPTLALSRKTTTSIICAAGLADSTTVQIVQLDGTVLGNIAVENVKVLDLAFDQLDRHFLLWEAEDSKIFMHWYDPLLSAYVTTEIAEGNNPCCQLDDYRDRFIPQSDILLFYQRGNEIFYRTQRDRYLIEYEVPHELENLILETCGMGTNLRFTLRIVSDDGIVLCAGQTPIRIGNNYVGLNWGEIPWAKSSSNTET